MFKKIDHVEVVTDEPDRSATFYSEVLGFRHQLRQSLPLPGGAVLDIIYLDLGGTGIELLTYRGLPKSPAPEGLQFGYRLMALEVGDMPTALAALQAKGVSASWGPVTLAEYTRAEIRDPDGNAIELRQWHRTLPARA